MDSAGLLNGLPPNLFVVELTNRGRIPIDRRHAVVGTSQALWPGIEIEHGGKVSTGPSSAPWIDTNTGFLRFLSEATSATIWMGEQPPRGNVFPVQRYALAVADAAVTNARWVVSVDEDFAKRLFARETRALEEIGALAVKGLSQPVVAFMPAQGGGATTSPQCRGDARAPS